MRDWSDRLQFLWEEETAPSPEPRPVTHDRPAVAAPWLQRATRFTLTAVLATTLMGQIIGVRLIAPVDAADQHACQRACRDAHLVRLDACKLLSTAAARTTCGQQSVTQYLACAAQCKP